MNAKYVPTRAETLDWIGLSEQQFQSLPTESRIAFWRLYLVEGVAIATRYLRVYFARLGQGQADRLVKRTPVLAGLGTNAFTMEQRLELVVLPLFEKGAKLTIEGVLKLLLKRIGSGVERESVLKLLRSLVQQWLLIEVDDRFQRRQGNTKPFRVGQRVVEMRGLRHERRGVIVEFQHSSSGVEAAILFDGFREPESIGLDWLSLETAETLEPGYRPSAIAVATPVARKQWRLRCELGEFTMRPTSSDCRFIAFARSGERVVSHAFAARSHLCAIDTLAHRLMPSYSLQDLQIDCYLITQEAAHGSHSSAA